MDYLITLAPSIIAVLTIIFAYLQNRDNNKSKQKEMIHAKKLEAYREMVVVLSDIRRAMTYYCVALGNPETDSKYEAQVAASRKDLQKHLSDAGQKYFYNRIFLPKDIDTGINAFLDICYDRGEDYQSVNACRNRMIKVEETIVEKLRKYLDA